MLISFQYMHFWAIFLPQFQSFHNEILKSTSRASKTLDFKNILTQVFFIKKQIWANLQQNQRKSSFLGHRSGYVTFISIKNFNFE